MAAERFKSYTDYQPYVQGAVEHWYKQAMSAMDALMDQKEIDKVEYVLLRSEAKYRIGRWHYLVNESKREDSAQPDSVGATLRRVAMDLPAFRRMVRSHNVRPDIRDLVIDTFRNDCRIIGDRRGVAMLSVPDQSEAEAVSKEANEILAQIDHPAASKPASATKPGEPVEFDP